MAPSNMNTAKMTGPLSKLPIELLERVIKTLCPHCTGDKGHPHWVSAGQGHTKRMNPRLGRASRALATISALSRGMKDMVLPHVYHQPATENWGLLARTLMDRTELAEHVKALVMRADYTARNDTRGSYHGVDVPASVVRKFADLLLASNPEHYDAHPLDLDSDEAVRAEILGVGRHVALSLLPHLSPNLEAIDAAVTCEHAFSMLPDDSLGSLRSLTVHLQPAPGSDSPPRFPEHILRAASDELATLTVYEDPGRDHNPFDHLDLEKPFDNITTLVIHDGNYRENYGGSPGLPVWFPCLQTLRYTGCSLGNTSGAEPPEQIVPFHWAAGVWLRWLVHNFKYLRTIVLDISGQTVNVPNETEMWFLRRLVIDMARLGVEITLVESARLAPGPFSGPFRARQDLEVVRLMMTDKRGE